MNADRADWEAERTARDAAAAEAARKLSTQDEELDRTRAELAHFKALQEQAFGW